MHILESGLHNPDTFSRQAYLMRNRRAIIGVSLAHQPPDPVRQATVRRCPGSVFVPI